MTDLDHHLRAALDTRAPFLAELTETDAYRVFHGAVEGRPGLTVDRYADILLVQSFRDPPDRTELDAIHAFARDALPEIAHVVWNHRGRPPVQPEPLSDDAARRREVFEHGLRYGFKARHRGIDPWLFLDFRAGRRRVRAHARGARVLNLFAYTCTMGIAAAAGGATEVVNVDFAASALRIGEHNALLNDLPDRRCRFDQADVLPTLRQLSGQGVRGRGARRAYRRYPQRTFELIVLDPPTWAKGPFGAIDPVRDYAALFKPCVLSTTPGGVILATNHVSTVDRQAWIDGLRRCAHKAGRPLTSVEIIRPDPDFPSPDDRAPLKMAWCTVGPERV